MNNPSQENKFNTLAIKLSEIYNEYSFSFRKTYTLYNQEIQIFNFSKKITYFGKHKFGLMLTFNGNPGDCIWNLQADDKDSIAGLMRIHNRISGRTQKYSQNIFKGKSFTGRAEEVEEQIEPAFVTRPRHDFITPKKIIPQYRNREKETYSHAKTTKQSSNLSQAKPTQTSFDVLKRFAKEKGWIKENKKPT
jgi:hypothetical protein